MSYDEIMIHFFMTFTRAVGCSDDFYYLDHSIDYGMFCVYIQWCVVLLFYS
jgi:hypothetical protein